MSQLTSAQIAFLDAVNEAGAAYLVIGGHAIIAHGCWRPANDLDIWIKSSKENNRRVAEAIECCTGVQLSDDDLAEMSRPMLLASVGSKLRNSKLAHRGILRLPGLGVEILSGIPNALTWNFDDYARRATKKWYEGRRLPFLALNDLFASKLLCERPKDINDVRRLKARHPRLAR